MGIAKWRKRTCVDDISTGPRQARSTVLCVEDEAIVVAFPRHTLLPLNDCLYVLQATVPHLTRSSLHRCLQRHGTSRLSNVEGDKPGKRTCKSYSIGYVHIDVEPRGSPDMAEVQTAEGKIDLYVAIDRTSKRAVVQLVRKTARTSASALLMHVVAAIPYKIHTVLTDNGTQFTFPPRYADGRTAQYMTHKFNMCCRENGIEHRLTKIKHPWTNGQVEHMNRTIKEVTVKRYNYGRRPKTFRGLTPYKFICKNPTIESEKSRFNSLHQTPEPNILALKSFASYHSNR